MSAIKAYRLFGLLILFDVATIRRDDRQSASLREAVAAQDLSPEDVQRMVNERARLKEAMVKV